MQSTARPNPKQSTLLVIGEMRPGTVPFRIQKAVGSTNDHPKDSDNHFGLTGTESKFGSALSNQSSYFLAAASEELKKIKPLHSYGQFGEDAMLQALLPAKAGFYIDIGSGHPILGSNTYALYELGWRGILVDPVRANVDLSQRVRPGDSSLHAAIGLSDSESVDFIEFETYQYSTTSESRAAEVFALGHKIAARYSVRILPLQQILPSEIPSGPTVMTVDVEGEEMGVLVTNDWVKFRPDFLLIEDLTPPIQRSTAVSEFLGSKNYELIGIAGVTSLYRRLD